MLKLGYLFQLSIIIFNHEHLDAFGPFWAWEYKFFVIEIGLLHSRPFIKQHFHFLIIVECAKSWSHVNMLWDYVENK
jgi:hypothetical protein